MKIQLSSTLPFTPLQLDSSPAQPRRVVGQLFGKVEGCEFSQAVYQYRHSDNDTVHYQVDPRERIYLDQTPPGTECNSGTQAAEAGESLQWILHTDALTYKPYAFLVMNAITRLVADWDGVVYRTPSGEQLQDTARDNTLQVVDACVSDQCGLWVMVNMTDQQGTAALGSNGNRQMGWVPV